jgi:hypothetical protein
MPRNATTGSGHRLCKSAGAVALAPANGARRFQFRSMLRYQLRPPRNPVRANPHRNQCPPRSGDRWVRWHGKRLCCARSLPRGDRTEPSVSSSAPRQYCQAVIAQSPTGSFPAAENELERDVRQTPSRCCSLPRATTGQPAHAGCAGRAPSVGRTDRSHAIGRDSMEPG